MKPDKDAWNRTEFPLDKEYKAFDLCNRWVSHVDKQMSCSVELEVLKK